MPLAGLRAASSWTVAPLQFFLSNSPRDRSLRVLFEVGDALLNELFLGGGKLAVVEPIVGGETVELIEFGADLASLIRLEEREGGEDLGFAHRCGKLVGDPNAASAVAGRERLGKEWLAKYFFETQPELFAGLQLGQPRLKLGTDFVVAPLVRRNTGEKQTGQGLALGGGQRESLFGEINTGEGHEGHLSGVQARGKGALTSES